MFIEVKRRNVVTTETSVQRLYLMQVAQMVGVLVPLVSYLIQTDDGTNILIDSGIPETLPPGAPEVIMGESVPQQLAKLGLQPSDIHQLICTHFDMDHAGRLTTFKNAEWIVQRGHYEHALTAERFSRSRSQWEQPESQYRFVDGDTILRPGVELIETSGHTKGHQSVLVRLPNTGAVLLAIDAITRQELFVADREKTPMDEDGEAVQASARKLLDIAQREQVAFTVFGHDPVQWQTLKKLPEFYN
jgi:N-acyl homoserine lactone hydrolase